MLVVKKQSWKTLGFKPDSVCKAAASGKLRSPGRSERESTHPLLYFVRLFFRSLPREGPNQQRPSCWLFCLHVGLVSRCHGGVSFLCS